MAQKYTGNRNYVLSINDSPIVPFQIMSKSTPIMVNSYLAYIPQSLPPELCIVILIANQSKVTHLKNSEISLVWHWIRFTVSSSVTLATVMYNRSMKKWPAGFKCWQRKCQIFQVSTKISAMCFSQLINSFHKSCL